MRPLHIALAVTSVLVAPAYLQGDEGGGDPPVVQIYDSTPTEVDSLAIQVGEFFTLYGTAVGDVPLYYYWYLGEANPQLIATGNLLVDYSIPAVGRYVITLEVIDCNGLPGSDSVIVIVEEIPVPIQVTTWGRIKALFE
jgi:hypothetical protein